MAARAYWSGYLRLSLVSLPVRLHAATTSSNKISLHYVDRESGERIHYQPVVEDRAVDKANVAKGYEYEKRHYVILEDEDLKRLKLETAKTIDLVEFVDQADFDALYLDKPFYLVPDGPIAEDAYRVIREALRQAGKVGVGQIAIGGKERIVAVSPRERGMVLTTLRSKDEVRAPEATFDDIKEGKVDPEQVKLARTLIESKSATFDPEHFTDHYQTALKELVQAKLKGAKLPEPKRPAAQVIDLMEALRSSVSEAGGKPAARARTKPPAKSKRRGSTRKRDHAA